MEGSILKVWCQTFDILRFKKMDLFGWIQGLQIDLDGHGQSAKNKCRSVWGLAREAGGQQQANDIGGRVRGSSGLDKLAQGSRG